MSVAEWANTYDIHHWQILWSSYGKLTWVGFEPTTTEFWILFRRSNWLCYLAMSSTHSEPTFYSFSNFIFFLVSHSISAVYSVTSHFILVSETFLFIVSNHISDDVSICLIDKIDPSDPHKESINITGWKLLKP